VPYLPAVPGTPTFFFLKKDSKGNIVSLETVKNHFWLNDMISTMSTKTGSKQLKSDLFLDKTFQQIAFYQHNTLKDDFDFDEDKKSLDNDLKNDPSKSRDEIELIKDGRKKAQIQN
jgi:hypothetical protein